jgi:N6-adenosine-specific RNA methylase IME4/ParB-like chromosome segregation protein Spo0J
VTTLVPIDEILVGRKRRPLRAVDDLADSIARVGLLHPLVLTSDFRLVAGLHRLRACQALGWTRVPATIVPMKKMEAEIAELDENLVRQELTVLERGEMLARRKDLHEAIHPETKRGVAGGRASGASRRGEGTSDPVSLVRAIAATTGWSRRTIEREIQVATAIPADVREMLRRTVVADDKMALVRLARLSAVEQRMVASRIARGDTASVRTGIVQLTAERLRRRAPLPRGPFDVIVMDPPWPYRSDKSPYPSMTLDQIRDLPVPKLAAKDAVLWLWTTNAMMRHAYPLLDAWAFGEKTILTWHKTRSVVGSWLLNATEHCILATRGKPTVTLTTETTLLSAKNREHSRKPAEFYALVEAICPSRRRLDLFGRETRPGWTTWGMERTKFDRPA